MLPTFVVCFWATTAFAACSVRTKVLYASENDDARVHDQNYHAARFQSRASSVFGPSIQSSAAGFPYRFVFPANHPALNGPTMYSQYLQNNPQQSEQQEQYSNEDMYPLMSSKHIPLTEYNKHVQPPQHRQQLNFESLGKVQYDFLGADGKQHRTQQHQPYHMVKQPKHYQSYELAPSSPATTVHQSPYVSAGGVGTMAQPIMLLIPSGQPGAPYQTLVLVPSTSMPSIPPAFPGFSPPFPGQFPPNFPMARGPPLQIAGFPSGGGGGGGTGLAKYSGAQLFHRSLDPVQSHPHHQQKQKTLQKSSSSSSSPPSSSSLSLSSSSSYHHGSGSEHVPHVTGDGAEVQQSLEDKVSYGSEASGENSDERVDGSAETKGGEKTPSSEFGREKTPSSEFGEKTNTKILKRIVVT